MTSGKRRTREHVLADLSVNYVERVAFRCGYAVLRNTTADYGIDLYIYTCAPGGRVEEDVILVQLKATDRLPLLALGGDISFRIETADLLYWSRQVVPVLLVVYDGRRDLGFWIDIRAWARQRGTKPADWRTQTVQVRIPFSSRFNVPALKRVREYKNRAAAGQPG